MRVLLSILSTLALTLSGMGCTTMQAPVVPPLAGVYTNVMAPLDIDFDETVQGSGSKRGEASCSSVLWIVAWGDASTNAAAKNGDIQTIRSADYSYKSILSVYTKYTTVVYGD